MLGGSYPFNNTNLLLKFWEQYLIPSLNVVFVLFCFAFEGVIPTTDSGCRLLLWLFGPKPGRVQTVQCAQSRQKKEIRERVAVGTGMPLLPTATFARVLRVSFCLTPHQSLSPFLVDSPRVLDAPTFHAPFPLASWSKGALAVGYMRPVLRILLSVALRSRVWTLTAFY